MPRLRRSRTGGPAVNEEISLKLRAAALERRARAARRSANSYRGLAVMSLISAISAALAAIVMALTDGVWLGTIWAIVAGCWTWSAVMYRRAARSSTTEAELWEAAARSPHLLVD